MTRTNPTGIAGRVPLLYAAIRSQRGQWTTQRVRRLYHRLGEHAPRRATARHDLEHLHKRGHLDRIETVGRRYYLLRTT